MKNTAYTITNELTFPNYWRSIAIRLGIVGVILNLAAFTFILLANGLDFVPALMFAIVIYLLLISLIAAIRVRQSHKYNVTKLSLTFTPSALVIESVKVAKSEIAKEAIIRISLKRDTGVIKTKAGRFIFFIPESEQPALRTYLTEHQYPNA